MDENNSISKYNQLLYLKFFTLIANNEYNAYFISNCRTVELQYNFISGNIYWYNIRLPASGYTGIDFEEVLDLVSDDVKTELLFNLDLFR